MILFFFTSKSSRPDSVRNLNRSMCDTATQLLTNASSIQSMAISLQNFANRRNYTFISFAAPPQVDFKATFKNYRCVNIIKPKKILLMYLVKLCNQLHLTEVESSRTSSASRTHFQVLGLESQVLGLLWFI